MAVQGHRCHRRNESGQVDTVWNFKGEKRKRGQRLKAASVGDARDAEYRRAYRAWLDEMPSSEKKRMESMDKELLRPRSGGSAMRVNRATKSGGEAGDFANAIGAGVGDVVIGDVEIEVGPEERRFDELVALAPGGISGASARQFARNIITAETKKNRGAVGVNGVGSEPDAVARLAPSVWREMLRDVRDAKQPRLRLRVLLMAIGWADETAESGRSIGRDYVLSPEQVSNMVEEAQSKYGLPKNQFNKSQSATAKYRETNGK